jgi:hypothetical protein
MLIIFSNLIKKNNLKLPIILTDNILSTISNLIINLNHLFIIKESTSFSGDKLLFNFIESKVNNMQDLKFNMDLDLSKVIAHKSYKLPIKKINFLEGELSGIYCFKHLKSGSIFIGSALSFQARLRDHLNSLKGHRTATFFHE